MKDADSAIVRGASSKVVQELFDLLRKQPRGQDNDITFSEEGFIKLADIFDTLGIRAPVEIVKSGSTAIGFITSNHQFVRIGPSKDMEVVPTMLQPLLELDLDQYGQDFKKLRLEVMPEVKIGKVSDAEKIQLIKDTIYYGGFLWDDKNANIGRLDDGTPIVVDRGAIKPLDDEDIRNIVEFCSVLPREVLEPFRKAGDQRDQSEMIRILKEWAGSPTRDYATAQKAHRDHYGLKIGEVTGVFPAAKLDELRKISGDGIPRLIVEGRHDKESWHALMDEALTVAKQQGGTAWREHIREMSKNRSLERKS